MAAGEGIGYGWSYTPGSVTPAYGQWSRSASSTDYGTWETDPNGAGTHCHQRTASYPYLVATTLSATLTHFACTGASAGNGILRERVASDSAQPNEPELNWSATSPQLGISEQLYDPPNTAYDAAGAELVTLSLGANDVAFSDFVEACYGFSLTYSCNNSTADSDVASLLASQKANLRKVLQEIYDRGAAANKVPRVVVTTYYDPFPSTWDTWCPDIEVLPSAGLNQGEFDWLKAKLKLLNQSITEVASEFSNVQLVSLDGVLTDSNGFHGYCSAAPWVYGMSIYPSSARRGHTVMS